MPNIAVVVLDTLRKDAFDRHFEWLPGRSFENAWSTSHWTVPAHGSLFTGRYPTETGVRARAERFDVPDQSLIEALSGAGYRTTAYSCNPYVSTQYAFDRGFDRFEEGWRVASARPEIFDWGSAVLERSGPRWWRYARSAVDCLRSDADTLASFRHGYRLKRAQDDGASAVRDWVRSASWGDDEFLFVNLMEAHTPYTPPPAYRTGDVDPDFDPIRATATETAVDNEPYRRAYDGAVRYLSDVYRDIFESLRPRFDYVFTLSDHGELLGEYGEWTHFHGLYPELTHVPLSVYAGEATDESSRTPVSLLDVPATLAEVAGIDYPTRGVSLLEEPEGRPVLTESHGLTHSGRAKLRRVGISDRRIEALDGTRRGVVVPPSYYGYETDTGFQSDGETETADPRSVLSTLVDDLDERRVDEAAGEIPESVRQQLADLGYA